MEKATEFLLQTRNGKNKDIISLMDHLKVGSHCRNVRLAMLHATRGYALTAMKNNRKNAKEFLLKALHSLFASSIITNMKYKAPKKPEDKLRLACDVLGMLVAQDESSASPLPWDDVTKFNEKWFKDNGIYIKN